MPTNSRLWTMYVVITAHPAFSDETIGSKLHCSMMWLVQHPSSMELQRGFSGVQLPGSNLVQGRLAQHSA
jgi:hypothetical protein